MEKSRFVRKQLVVDCGKNMVSMSAGTSAIIKKHRDTVSVAVLQDRHRGSVFLSCGNANIEVGIGREVIVGDEQSVQSMVSDAVARRELRTLTSPASDQCIIGAEFSLVSLASRSDALRSLIFSSRSKDRSVYRSLLKDAACLTLVHAKYGPFKSN